MWVARAPGRLVGPLSSSVGGADRAGRAERGQRSQAVWMGDGGVDTETIRCKRQVKESPPPLPPVSACSPSTLMETPGASWCSGIVSKMRASWRDLRDKESWGGGGIRPQVGRRAPDQSGAIGLGPCL